MNVKIRSPFKPDKICDLIGFEGDLCKLQAVNEFSLPGLNLKPGDRFLMSLNEIIFPGEELAGDVMRVASEELAALKSQRDELLAACKQVVSKCHWPHCDEKYGDCEVHPDLMTALQTAIAHAEGGAK